MRCALDGEHGHPRCRLLFGEIIGEHRVKFVFVDEVFVAKIARHGTLQACSWQVLFYGKIKGEKLAFSVKYLALVICFLCQRLLTKHNKLYASTRGALVYSLLVEGGGLSLHQCGVSLFDAFGEVFAQLAVEAFYTTLLCVADAADNFCLQAKHFLYSGLDFGRQTAFFCVRKSANVEHFTTDLVHILFETFSTCHCFEIEG